MVEDIVWASIVLGFETLIVISLIYAGVQARRLKIYRHKPLMITNYLVQLTIWILWMLPKFMRDETNIFLRFSAILQLDPKMFWSVMLHIIIGSSVGILATFLVFVMVLFPEINVSKMKKLKPVMRLTIVLWILNYSLGVYNFINKYILID